jgi:hypothetical protein
VFLGLVHLRFRRPPAPPEWFLVAAMLPLAGLLLYPVGARYFVSLIPVLSIVAAIGLARLGRPEGPRTTHRLSAAGLLLFVIVLISFVPWIVRPWFRQDPSAVEKAAGLWLRHTAGPGTVFVGTYGLIGYYGGARGIAFGRRSMEELLSAGRKAGARYLIADNFNLPASRPDLMALGAGGQVSYPDLELVHTTEDRAGRRVFIYRIR